MNAWLIIREGFVRGGTGCDTRIERIVSILRGTMSGGAVRDHLLQLHMDTMGESIDVRLDFATRGHASRFWSYVTTTKHGMKIGHDPWLYARHVRNLRVIEHERDKVWLEWEDKSGTHRGPVYYTA
jgi:hypothetical protein